MKECCGLCPYSRKHTLFVHPYRAEEFAFAAENPYNDFVCHKTGVVHDDDEDGNIVRGEKSLTCAGFHAMQHLINGSEAEIEIDLSDHFGDTSEMIEHHSEEFEKNERLINK